MTNPASPTTPGTAVALATRAGVVIDVRPIAPEDEPALAAFYDRVSEEDRRFRFLSAAPHVSHQQLLPFVTVDHFRSEGFLAFDHKSAELVACALLASDGRGDTAEVAVSVRADYRGKGLGWSLLDFLAGEARKRGHRRVIAIESRQNHDAIELEREKGFMPETFEGDPSLVLLAKML